MGPHRWNWFIVCLFDIDLYFISCACICVAFRLGKQYFYDLCMLVWHICPQSYYLCFLLRTTGAVRVEEIMKNGISLCLLVPSEHQLYQNSKKAGVLGLYFLINLFRVPLGTDGWMEYVPISKKKNSSAVMVQQLQEGSLMSCRVFTMFGGNNSCVTSLCFYIMWWSKPTVQKNLLS